MLFVAVTALLYFLVKKEWRWVVLLIASYVFFWMNSKWLLFIMAGSSLFTYFIGRCIHKNTRTAAWILKENAAVLLPADKKSIKAEKKSKNKKFLLLGLFVNFGILLFLKYYNFFGGNFNHLMQLLGIEARARSLDLLLPLGISFYTLQAAAYLIDLYREKYAAEKSPFRFLLFMSYFPLITQGPISRYDQLAKQLYRGHEFSYERMTRGMQLILWGLMKKLIIADRIAIPVNLIFDHSSTYGGVLLLFAAMGYGIQVYTDFSGGMDIVRGVSRIFGIELAENFRQPYFSRSIEEFWRRWHITLGAWMKDYVFYPLSLSRFSKKIGKVSRKLFGSQTGKKIPTFLAMFVVYFFVGFWHGAQWKYIVYGLWNGVFIMSGILLEGRYVWLCKKLRINTETFSWRLFQIARTFLICSVGRLFSRGENLKTAFSMIKGMVWTSGRSSFANAVKGGLGLTPANWILLLLMLLLLVAVDMIHEKGISISGFLGKQNLIFRWVVYYLAILSLLIFGIYGNIQGGTGFIYQQF